MAKIALLIALGLAAAFLSSCGSTLGGPDGGGGGTTGTGGAAGTGACLAAFTVDRSCDTDSDCIPVAHTSNCCGSTVFIGIRASAQARFQELEAECDASYPACGCAAIQPTADDGSRLRFDGVAGVACVQGRCTSYSAECGHPCAIGTTCFSCSNRTSVFAACTTACGGDLTCPDPAMPFCQSGSSGNTAGIYCTPVDVACDTR
jgi:hypothetical protein